MCTQSYRNFKNISKIYRLPSKTKKIQFSGSQFPLWVKFVIYNLIYMNIHVKKTVEA